MLWGSAAAHILAKVWARSTCVTTTTGRASSVADRLRGSAASAPALNGDDLEVESSEIHSGSGPGPEVVLNGDGAARTAALAHRNVLIKGARAHNGRLIDALILPNHIGAAVTGNGALLGARWRIAARVFNDIVFHERVLGPPVHGQGAQATADAERAAVGNGTACKSLLVIHRNKLKGEEHDTHEVLPGFQPTPTTKSSVVSKVRENPPLEGVKSTVPPVV